jgi:hypothetical protein
VKFCDDHVAKLRAAISARGLEHLVTKSESEAVARAKAEAEGNLPEGLYDPLLCAEHMIASKALELGGMYLLKGDYCPVCEAMVHASGTKDSNGRMITDKIVEKDWIDGPADAVLAYCRAQGLLLIVTVN